MKQIVYFFLTFCSGLNLYGINSIGIMADEGYFQNSITQLTLQDVKSLLTESFNCRVDFNNSKAEIILALPKISNLNPELRSSPSAEQLYPFSSIPLHNYGWDAKVSEGVQILKLSATSFQGISFGLYGLLQEKLGFAFYHPRETIIPKHTNWPLKPEFNWAAKPVFDKKGFHLHTQHPLELTEQLHDPTFPNALNDVKEYLNWLVRNGQNYFEFCLLENINRKIWPTHAKAIVDYGHSRGILVAVDFSLHMIQQKTFQMYLSPTQSLVSKEGQVIKNLAWLMQADWDYLNMEFSAAEFIGGNRKKKEALRLKMIAWLQVHKPKTKMMGRQHIVKHDNEQVVSGKQFHWDSTSTALDRQRGVLSHTVMFYDMTENNAPVYQNKNQRHQFHFLKEQSKIRETWYYPESAYWVTFDNSVPMLLLPYLTARLADIDTCQSYNVPGHITFSSGWEWGYWLIDWSIARWSWDHWENNKKQTKTSDEYVSNSVLNFVPSQKENTANPALNFKTTAIEYDQNNWFKEQLNLQQIYLKDSNLIQWLTAMSITDELPNGMNNEFHPRPPLSYKYLRRKANLAEISLVRKTILPKLKYFETKVIEFNYQINISTSNSLKSEILDGTQITALRARHRFFTLSYLLAKRESKISGKSCRCDSLLEKATETRKLALEIVKRREQHYRYPLSLIANQLKGHTAYDFGYLYPVQSLQFWYREEEQARHNRLGPLYKTLFNPFKIIGLVD